MAVDASASQPAGPAPRSTSGGVSKGVVFQDVGLSFQGQPILRSLNLAIAPGEVVGFVGGSGVGKTSLLNLVAGLIDPSSGKVTVDGQAPADRMRETAAGFLFQQPTLLPWLKAIDYVALPLLVKRRPAALLNPFNRLTEREVSAARLALAKAQVPHVEHMRAAQLSGGMQTRVALARTIVAEPDMMLLDEPFNSLDERLRADIYAVLQAIIAERRATTLLVTHNVLEAVLLCDRVVLLARPKDNPERGAIAAFEQRIDLPRPRTLEHADDPPFVAAMKSVREALFAL
ncbi:MAG: ATP-binding cassette domain-containing protein [Alphaproteobacteria bacterium]|nr:ATP-binding cassette domain-containing protein [Alphaproteobacteria bacterium]